MLQNLNKIHFSGVSSVRYGLPKINRRLVVVLVALFGLMTIAYAVTSIWINRAEDRIRDAGIEMTRELSQSISLPLLEENTPSIQSMLAYAAKSKNIVYASILDHRNEIVTQVGNEENLPEKNEAVLTINQVSIWESKLAKRKKIVSFSSDVTYAGTKIGEIFIALPGAESSTIRNQLKIAVVSVFLLLIAFGVVLRYCDVSSGVMRLSHFCQRKAGGQSDIDPVLTDAFVTCPMCGNRKVFTPDVFSDSHLEEVFLFKIPKKEKGDANSDVSEGLQLTELNKREDLSWLKRQVIMRCTEIIMKLSE